MRNDSAPFAGSQTQIPDERRAIRRQMRRLRRALSPEQQAQAARELKRHLSNHPLFLRAQSVALYLANDGEIDPLPLARLLWQRGRRCYLPVLHPVLENQLWFYEFTPDTQLRPNRYRILEPVIERQARRPAWSLSLILMPLVAFDDAGNRLGMGGGYYDRTFAFLRRRAWLRPRLVGLAHDFQRVECLDSRDWDVPLDAVATDRKFYDFRRRRRKLP